MRDGHRSLNRASQFAFVVGLHLLTLALLALHLYVYRFPPTSTAIPETDSLEAAWWGLWPITHLPGWAVICGSILIVSSIAVVYLSGYISTKSTESSRKGSGNCSQQKVFVTPFWKMTAQILIPALFIAAFFAFPIAHTRWGDAYILTNAIAWPDPALRLTHSWQAPLDVFFHSQLWLAFHEQFGWSDAMPVYRLLSPVAGALYLLIILALSRDARAAPAWLTFGLLTTLGMMQLFFGYVENYSFAAVGILTYLWLGIGVLRGERPLWLAALALALTHATHPSTIVLAPSLLYCGWQIIRGIRRDERSTENTKRRNLSRLMVVFQIALPMLIVAGSTVVLMEVGDHGLQTLLTTDRPGGSDARWFVPLLETETRWEHYTLLSWLHLRDFINQQLLVAPIVLVSLIFVGGKLILQSRYDSITPSQSQARAIRLFLLIASSCYLLFTWFWNPDYGGQRDWDLFSLASLPTTLLLIVLLPKVLPEVRFLKAGIVPLLLLQSFHTIAWLYQNTLSWAWPT